jgi:hypothetical protein
MYSVTLRYPPKTWTIEVDPSESVDTLKIQAFSLSNLDPDKQDLLLVGYGPLTDDTDLASIDWATHTEIVMSLKVEIEGWQECCTKIISKDEISQPAYKCSDAQFVCATC